VESIQNKCSLRQASVSTAKASKHDIFPSESTERTERTERVARMQRYCHIFIWASDSNACGGKISLSEDTPKCSWEHGGSGTRLASVTYDW
jgi:hypothetical protein